MCKENRPQYISQINAFHRFIETHYLPLNAQILWFRLIDLCNRNGWEPWLCIDTLRLMTLVGAKCDKTALLARDKLCEAGLLVYEKGKKGQPSRYRMVWFPRNDSVESSGESSVESFPNAPENPSETHTSNTRKEKEKTREEYKGVPAPLSEAFDAYVEMRKKMRRPLTASAKPLVLRALEALAPGRPDAQRAILEQSILNGWAGVFPLKKEAPEPPASYDVEELERRLLYGKIEYKKRE